MFFYFFTVPYSIPLFTNQLKNPLVVAAPATEKVAPENIQKKRSRASAGKGSKRIECSSFKAQTELVRSTSFY